MDIFTSSFIEKTLRKQHVPAKDLNGVIEG